MSKYFLSVCAIARAEGPFLREWICFHKLQGVEHFFIYNNDPPEMVGWDHWMLADDSAVTLIPWPGAQQQCKAYQHCLDNHGAKSEFMAFIDIDEFLWSPAGQLSHMISPDNDVGALAVHWMLFGSNGHTEKTNGLVLERFTRRGRDPDQHVKSIVRPHAVRSAGKNPHIFYLRPGFNGVDELGNVLPVEYARLSGGSAEVYRINHYVTKSRAEYFARKRLGDANSGLIPTEERIAEMFRVHDCNDTPDETLKELYAERIKKC